MLKQVLIIRHGYYGDDDRLNSKGRSQMEAIANQFIPKFGMDKSNTIILSSSAPRAEDSAVVISNITDIPVKTFLELWSDNWHYQNDERALALIKDECEKANIERVIIVTHLEYASSLRHIILEDAGKRFNTYPIPEKGCASFFNLETEESDKFVQ